MYNLTSKEMLKDYFFGVGWNCYGVAANPPYPYHTILDEWMFENASVVAAEDMRRPLVESHYWLLLSETGYLGFASYILFVFVMWFRETF